LAGRRHPDQVLRVFVDHYNTHRPHRALDLRPPNAERPTPLRGSKWRFGESALAVAPRGALLVVVAPAIPVSRARARVPDRAGLRNRYLPLTGLLAASSGGSSGRHGEVS